MDNSLHQFHFACMQWAGSAKGIKGIKRRMGRKFYSEQICLPLLTARIPWEQRQTVVLEKPQTKQLPCAGISNWTHQLLMPIRVLPGNNLKDQSAAPGGTAVPLPEHTGAIKHSLKKLQVGGEGKHL